MKAQLSVPYFAFMSRYVTCISRVGKSKTLPMIGYDGGLGGSGNFRPCDEACLVLHRAKTSTTRRMTPHEVWTSNMAARILW